MTEFDLANGNMISSGKMAYAPAFTPAVKSGGVYVTTTKGLLYVLDGSTMQTLSVSAGYKISNNGTDPLFADSGPIIAGNTVIVQSHQPGISGDATIVAFPAN